MHILFITSYYPSQNAPITGIFFHDQATALHKAGHQVGVIVTPRINVTLEEVKRDGLSKLRALTRDAYFQDFPVYRMHWGWFPRVAPPLVAWLTGGAGLRAYERYVREHGQPDVIHGHNTFYGGYVAARIGQRYHLPVVLTEYSSSYLEGLVFLPGQSQIVQYTLRHVDVRLTCGQSLVGALHRYAPEQPIDVIGCIVDTSYFELAPHPPEPPPFIFLVIAQLKERRKGFDILLKAFHKAFADRPDVQLHIRGHGPLKPELEKLVEALNLQTQVKFLGMMTRDQLRDLIYQSHALVSSSYVETFGVTVAEAMACGRPVVSTRSGGPEDFVTERSGILLPPRDLDALAEAMEKMVAEYAQFDPPAVREDCVSRFSEDVYVARLEDVYRQALSSHR